MTETLKLTGLHEVVADLRALGNKKSKSIVGKAVRKGLKIIQAAEKAEAPVRSGLMRKKIQIYSPKGRPGTIKLALRPKAYNKGFFYPAVVISGKGRKFLGRGKSKTLNPAKKGGNDFVTRAFEATKEQAATITAAEIEAGIAKAAAEM